jgi:hypothetical protein
MKNLSVVGLCALCAVCAMAAVSSAANITFGANDTTTAPAAWASKYGSADYMVYDFATGKPDVAKGYYTKNGSSNPSYVADFYWDTPGSSSGSGSGSGSASPGSQVAGGDLFYDLVLNEGKSFQFTSLFYDSGYGTDNGLNDADVALKVRLLGDNDVDDTWHEITVAQLEAGIFLSWNVTIYDDDATKAITMDVDFVNGDGAYAAGFFLDSVADTGNAPLVPEPASIGLVLFGVAGLFARPKRKA